MGEAVVVVVVVPVVVVPVVLLPVVLLPVVLAPWVPPSFCETRSWHPTRVPTRLDPSRPWRVRRAQRVPLTNEGTDRRLISAAR